MALFKKHKTEPVPPEDTGAHDTSVGTAADVEAVMKKYDRESNTRVWEGLPKLVIRWLMVAFSAYCIIDTVFLSTRQEVRLPMFVGLILLFGFLTFPAKKGDERVNHMPWYDIVLLIAGPGAYFFYAVNAQNVVQMSARVMQNDLYMIIGLIGILALVELCRRCVGLPILCVAGVLLVYTFFNLGGSADFKMTLYQVIRTMFYTFNGIFGGPISVCAKFIVVFIIFGAFLERTGIAQFFINLANAVAGAAPGGPAKVAVISSALCGMVSGSSVGNTVTTGSVTIPMMKKTGYKPEFAGAVEAAASTGGQIMPPIMGAGAFIMAEIIGVQYAQIAAAAVLPAVAYFLAVFILVHMIAKKKGLGKDSGVHYEGKPILPRVYRLLPIIVLVIMIIIGYSLPRSAIYCTIFSIIIAAISPETRMGPRKLLQTLMDGVRQAANIAIPTAACGIMIGIVVNSGVAVKIAKLIGTSGEGSLFIALLIAALGCLLLGMALPTVAAYLIAVTLFASAIQGLGISALVTNMFIFYFGVVAQITPPVCLASFTAAGIAGASAWKTGWKAFSFAITAFIVPFAFVYRPAILLEGTMVEIIIAYCIVVAATYLLACGIAGYLFRPLKMWERIACYIVAFIFILPSSMSDIIGIAGCALIMAYCFMTGKKNANKAQPA